MTIHLVVVQDFGSHTKGSLIVDPAEVAATLAGESAAKVVRISVPVVAAPASVQPPSDAPAKAPEA